MKKKIFSIGLMTSLVCMLFVGGTLAYFEDQEAAKNIFTIGQVDIGLDEPLWDDQAQNVLIPGITILKDPTVTIQKDSEDCYLFLEIKLPQSTLLEMMYKLDGSNYKNPSKFYKAMLKNEGLARKVVSKWFNGINYDDWKIMSTPEANGILKNEMVFILGYTGNDNPILSQGDQVTFMKSFTMPSQVTKEMIPENTNIFELDFKAYAIQSVGIESLDIAYDAIFTKE